MKEAAKTRDKIPAPAATQTDGAGLIISFCGIAVTVGSVLGNTGSTFFSAPIFTLFGKLTGGFSAKDGITSIFLIGGGGGTAGCLCAIGTIGSGDFFIFFFTNDQKLGRIMPSG